MSMFYMIDIEMFAISSLLGIINIVVNNYNLQLGHFNTCTFLKKDYMYL